MAERRLDRLVQFDEKSRNFPIRTLLPSLKPRSYTWRCNTWLDQGSEGACVGFSWAHEAAARPKEHLMTPQFAQLVYKRAQQLDSWPGENYDGTSVIAGAKAMVEKGYLKEYRWGFSLLDALNAISRFGPVVLGVNWYSGMWDVDNDGFVHASGDVVGGHAILAVGVKIVWREGTTKAQKNADDWLRYVDMDRSYVLLHNSWGPAWGINGKAKLSWTDLAKLLREDGECCVPVVR